MSKPEDNKPGIIEKEPLMAMDAVDEILGNREPEVKAEAKKATFSPKVPQNVAEQRQTEDVAANIAMRLQEVADRHESLKAGPTVRVAKATKTPAGIDFSKLSEKDVYDMDIPIQAISHDLPDSMEIKLKDPAYVARWVSTHPQRLGTMKAVGYTYVTPEDLAEKLSLAVDFDENGQYKYNDVVAMKVQKEKYYGALRKNHLRAIAMVSRDKAHQIGKRLVESEMSSGIDPDTHQSVGRDYAHYKNQGLIEVYVPGQK